MCCVIYKFRFYWLFNYLLYMGLGELIDFFEFSLFIFEMRMRIVFIVFLIWGLNE